MKKLLAVVAIFGLLGGCAVYTPEGAVVIDPVPDGHYHIEGGGGGGGGHFCPPGQAKKGNC